MKAAVFDLDGTLIHSAPDIHASANTMLAALGRPALDLATIISFIGNGVPKLVERCLAATGGDQSAYDQALTLFNTAYAADPIALTRPYDGVEALLAALRRSGVALGVCTNKPQALTEVILDRLQLRFDVVVGGDRLSVKKPDPAPLRLCFEELGFDARNLAPGSGLYIGDSETDEATAQALGVDFAFFTGGYRKKHADDFTAAIRFDAFSELQAALEARIAAAPALRR